MLKPAIIRREEILAKMYEMFYSDKMFYLSGCNGNWIPNISEDNASSDRRFQYAVVDPDDVLIGFLDYTIDWYGSTAHHFAIVSFDEGNPAFAKDIYSEIIKILKEYKLHRIEWRMIAGNHAERGYDSLCKKFNGTKHVLRDAVKDRYGNYHDDIIYEIINKEA